MQKFVKAFSLAVSAALCIGMLTQYNLENTKADSSASDTDYAISMMGRFATFTEGDFDDPCHSMAPIAVGGNFKSTYFMMTDNQKKGYFRDFGPDLAIGGKIDNGTGKLDLMFGSENGYKDFTVAVKEGNISASQFGALYEPNNSSSVQKRVNTYHDFDYPIDFNKAFKGFKDLSNSINKYATSEDSNAINVQVVNKTAELVGTSEYNVFNLSSGDFTKVILYVPVNSHNIVNFPGNNTNNVQVELNYISNVRTNADGSYTYDSYRAWNGDNFGEGTVNSANGIYLNQNLVFNAATAEKIGDFTNGSVLAPNANVTIEGNTNGALICHSFKSNGGAEFHGANMGGSFTWLKEFDIEITTEILVHKTAIGGVYAGEELPGALLYFSGVDFEGNVIDVSGYELDLGKGAEEYGRSNAKIGWYSGSEPTLIKGIKDGIYTIREDAAPAGYNVTTDIYFTVKDGVIYDGATVLEQNKLSDNYVKVYDRAWTVIKISKIAVGGEYDGTELPGAKLTLIAEKIDNRNSEFAFEKDMLETGEGATFSDCSANEISWISGKTPTYISLPNGSYLLKEVAAPEGYQVTTDISFDVKDGKVFNVQSVIDTDSNHIGMFDDAIPTEEPTPEVTPEITPEPTPEVTVEITPEPTPEVTVEITPEPTPEVTVEITPEPTPEVTVEITPEPTPEVTVEITPEPTPEVTVEITPEPTPEVTVEITPEPTPEVTVEITPEPTPEVIVEVTPEPTPEVTVEITPEPTPVIVVEPGEEPDEPTVPPTNSELKVGTVEESEPTPTPTPAVKESTPTPEVKVERITVEEPTPEIVTDMIEEEEPTTTPEAEATPTPSTIVVENPPEVPNRTTPEKPSQPSITSTGESSSMTTILGWSAFTLAALIIAVEIVHKKVNKKKNHY